MEQIIAILGSVPFVGIAVIVAFLMFGLNKLGAKLWSLNKPWLRKTIKGLHSLMPYFPALFGAALGAIPWWPAPEPFAQLSPDKLIWVMIILGFFAGLAWEKVWKGFKQAAETAGINIDIDEPPSKQGKC